MPVRGVIAGGHEVTVEAAEAMLRDGGNAYDAVLAAHLAACAAEPVLASLGGGGFLIAQPHNGQPVVYDFFVQTPQRKRPTTELSFRPIFANFGTAQQQFHIGQGTVATPGSMKGICQIHRDLGTLPLTAIAAPAIHYARHGVSLNPIQAYIFRIVSPILMATPEAREVFFGDRSRQQPRESGEVIRQPQLADTLERLGQEGDRFFYEGDLGRADCLAVSTGRRPIDGSRSGSLPSRQTQTATRRLSRRAGDHESTSLCGRHPDCVGARIAEGCPTEQDNIW